MVNRITDHAVSIDNVVSRSLLGCSFKTGLPARIAELGEMEFHVLSRFEESSAVLDQAASATAVLSAKMAEISAGQLQIVRWHEAVSGLTAGFQDDVTNMMMGIRTLELDVVRRIEAAILPLIKLPPLDLPEGWDPPNWRSVPDIDFEAAIALVNEGVPLVWVPRGSIVAKLLEAADGPARDVVLVSSRDEIAEDCMDVLAEITADELKELADLAATAVGAIQNGFGPPAQALGANILDTVLRKAASRGVLLSAPKPKVSFYKHVTSQVSLVTGDVGLFDFQAACVLAPVITALASFWPSTDPTPTRFGRHATAHRVDLMQYTEANAIVAVMLAVSVLREAEESGW